MAKKQTLNDSTIEELHTAVEGGREELRSLRFSVAGSKNRDVKQVKKLRKDIARALTEITARRLSTKLEANKQ